MAALAVDPGASFGDTAMDLDMDIDIDLGIPEEEYQNAAQGSTEFGARPTAQQISTFETTAAEVVTKEEDQLVPQKVNIQGVDELSTSNLQSYANEYFPDQKPTVEWINDSSVNFVFDDAEIATQALSAFVSADAVQPGNPDQGFVAKPLATHPSAQLFVRIAMFKDKKKPRAREASRYYLLHPEEEERSKRRPHRRRRRSDEEVEKFDASMYDDDESAVTSRRKTRETRSVDRRRDNHRDRSRSPDRSASPGSRRYGRDRGNGRERDILRRQGNGGKELFADPVRKAASNKVAANSLKKELFPLRSGIAADEAADLFSSKMSVPFVDGAADVEDFPLRSDALFQKQKKRDKQEEQGFSIKGAALGADDGQGFSIRGAAGQKKSIKELFPDKTSGSNAGKELFGASRVPRRNKAADLFG